MAELIILLELGLELRVQVTALAQLVDHLVELSPVHVDALVLLLDYLQGLALVVVLLVY